MKINYKAIDKNPEKYAKSLNISDLVSMLKLFDYYYHTKNAEKIPDQKYDIMKDVLEERSPRNKYLKEVGAPVRKGKKKVKLLATMPSLGKLKPGMAALSKFLEHKGSYIVGDKLDGISLQLVYKNGKLVQVTTRGKGKYGQDVSSVIPSLKCPKIIAEKQTTSIRSELVIKHGVFKQYSGDFETDRNMGGGLLNRNEPPEELKSFDVVAYEVMHGPLKGAQYSKQLTWLKSQKFKVVPYKKFTSLTEERLIKLLESRKKKTKYPIDGIVLTKNAPYTRVSGVEKPNYQKAFKINTDDNSRIATVVRVEYNTSRNDVLAPKIIIEPIKLGGVTVTHFTAHNLYYIIHGWASKDAKHNIGKKPRPIGPGAKLKVIRSGDVIPYIQEVVTPSKTPQLPEIPYKMDKHGKKAVAINKSSDQKIKAITFFFSTLEVEGLKSATIKVMYDQGYDSIKSILDMSIEEMSDLPRFTINKASTLRRNIDKAMNNLTFARLGTASGIFKHMGEKKLDAVYEAYPEILSMVKLPHTELVDKIRGIKGFAETADTIALGLPKFVRFIKRHSLNIKPPKTVLVNSNILKGRKYLLTGVRDPSTIDFIKGNGGSIASGVKSSDVVIVKDEDYENKKTETAKQLGITVVTIDKFKRKYGI